MKERRAFVTVALVVLLVAGGNLLFTINAINAGQHKFCQLITASLAGVPTPQKPADPKKDPSRERLYENYEIVLHLGQSLGCV